MATETEDDQEVKWTSAQLQEDRFETFWNTGMVKAGKKAAKKAFSKAIAKKKDPEKFLYCLIGDIHSRLVCQQLGFDKLHPATYLNGERWKDEIVDNLPF